MSKFRYFFQFHCFFFVLFRKIEVKNDLQLQEKCENLFKLNRKMKIENPVLRPNCETILSEKNSWALSLRDIENDDNFEEFNNQSLDIEKSFSSYFISKKFKISNQL
jgi:hypothetical protein